MDITNLQNQINSSTIPADLKELLLNKLHTPTDIEVNYIQFMLQLPFQNSSADILDIKRSSSVLEKNHYGLKPVKDRVLEYLATLILNQRKGVKYHAPILAFVGLVGSGKTSLASSVAESLGRKLIRIPLGGLGSASLLKGRSKSYPEAEAGFLMKSVVKSGVNNPVILLDEVDRVSPEARSEIMGVLVELLDPEQNANFTDYYIDYPFDLSKVLFIATANNTTNISTAVMDRLEIIEMPSYSDEEKTIIAKQHILPKIMVQSGLEASVISFNDDVWPLLIRPLGYDGGIRSLQRAIQSVVRKVALQVVEGGQGPYNITAQNIGGYIA